MSRPLRIEYPGAVYHVTGRGNARLPIVEGDMDRLMFVDVLKDTVERFNWICHAYCLMDNHYHLLIETVDANLSKGMRNLNGGYTQLFNRTHNRVGHLFQGRFKAILVEKESYLLELCRYIVMNPVAAGMAEKPEEYKWSSYLETVGKTKARGFVSPDWVLSQFSEKRVTAQKRYVLFVKKEPLSKEGMWKNLQSQIILGGRDFLSSVKDLIKIKDGKDLQEVPRIQKAAARTSLEDIFVKDSIKTKNDRNMRIINACIGHGYSFSEVGRYMGLHYATISRIARCK